MDNKGRASIFLRGALVSGILLLSGVRVRAEAIRDNAPALAHAALGVHPHQAERESKPVRPDSQPVREIDLSRLLNRHWRTPAAFAMEGKTAYASTGFDREQTVFLSLYRESSAAPRFFDVMKSLLNKTVRMPVEQAVYLIRVNHGIIEPPKQSKLLVWNQSTPKNRYEATVQQLMNAVYSVGEPLELSGQAYRVFYANDVMAGPDGPAPNPSVLTLAFVLQDKNDLHSYWIPAEQVPSDPAAVFKLHKGCRVGLQIVGNSLKIFENP